MVEAGLVTRNIRAYSHNQVSGLFPGIRPIWGDGMACYNTVGGMTVVGVTTYYTTPTAQLKSWWGIADVPTPYSASILNIRMIVEASA